MRTGDNGEDEGSFGGKNDEGQGPLKASGLTRWRCIASIAFAMGW